MFVKPSYHKDYPPESVSQRFAQKYHENINFMKMLSLKSLLRTSNVTVYVEYLCLLIDWWKSLLLELCFDLMLNIMYACCMYHCIIHCHVKRQKISFLYQTQTHTYTHIYTYMCVCLCISIYNLYHIFSVTYYMHIYVRLLLIWGFQGYAEKFTILALISKSFITLWSLK